MVADDVTKAIVTTCKLDVKRSFFTRRVMHHGNRLLKWVVELLSLRFLRQSRQSSRWPELLLIIQDADLEISQRILPIFLWYHVWYNKISCGRTLSHRLKSRTLFSFCAFYLQVCFSGKLYCLRITVRWRKYWQLFYLGRKKCNSCFALILEGSAKVFWNSSLCDLGATKAHY